MKQIIVKNYIAIAVVGGLIVLGGAYWYVASSGAPSFNTISAVRGNVVQSVAESGNVLAENSVSLSFQEGGQISHVYVKEGDSVSQGTQLADLDESQLATALSQANAAAAAAQARLDELMSGTRPEQLQVDKGAAANAQAALSASILNAYAQADDAVRNQTDNLFSNPQSNNPIFTVPVTNSQQQINIQGSRAAIGVSLNRWYAALSATSTDLAALSATADVSLHDVQSYLNAVAIVVNAATPNLGIAPATLAAYKANVVAARTEVTAAVNALTTAEATMTNANNTLLLAEAGATPQDIAAGKAALLQTQAGVAGATVALDHASLRAPFAGVVQGLTAKVGQVVSPGGPVVSVVNNSGLKIEVFVSEADVAKIKSGDAAQVTLDAYGTGTVFPAAVTTIDASKTISNNTPAYKITLHFTNPDARVKDGMTANVRIVAAEHDNVIAVPSRLLVNENAGSFVLVKNGSGSEKRSVTVGISGDDGSTEIVSGLSEGDHLINF